MLAFIESSYFVNVVDTINSTAQNIYFQGKFIFISIVYKYVIFGDAEKCHSMTW